MRDAEFKGLEACTPASINVKIDVRAAEYPEQA